MTTALLSIKPIYAQRIMSGDKRFEFRKCKFARLVNRVVIYSSSPVKKVIGEFEVENVLDGPKDIIWEYCKEFAGIEKAAYDKYYANHANAVAIVIGKTTKYSQPRDLLSFYGTTPPQSYRYLAGRN